MTSTNPSTCRCGCGEDLQPGRDWPSGPGARGGHDQTALHQRIARIGSTAEFCDWMDQFVPGAEDAPT